MSQKPIIIIGAGMAGCYLAILLAKKGYKVHVLEKRETIDPVMKESGRGTRDTLPHSVHRHHENITR